MKTKRLLLLTLVSWPTLGSTQENAGRLDWSLSFRPRYEFIDQDPLPNNANALTMRTLAGYTFRPISSLNARVGGGLIWPRAFVRMDYEVLASRDGIFTFQMPLAHNHAYLGWSDLFTVTPRQGRRD